ncbi:MAG TPA: hypothetical protein VLM89_06300, partial [Phycisphaerae bacterium]|nr:hypothetical protein [Phycisphaerae bacterium]
YEVNTVGQDSRLPGVIFSGVVPNPFAASTPNEDRARAGNSTPYKVEGGMADAFDSEGLRSVTLIPDQDGDGKQEIVFGVPWCNSYSLSSQVAHGIHPAPLAGLGRLENNGHFLRGGVVAVSSRNSLLANRQAISRHFDRVMQLDEVGQVFNPMVPVPSSPYPYRRDLCPPGSPDGTYDYVTWPCEGFTQNTAAIDPPRLATPPIAGDLIIPPSVLWPLDDQLPGGCGETIAISQVDTPPPPSDPFFVGGRNPLNYTTDACTPVWPALGLMHVLGTGFYSSGTTCGDRVMAEAREPYGCRILGQTTTQCPAPPVCDSYANRFGASLSKSGDFLLIGAPLRTATRGDVPTLPTADRREAGVVYVLQLRRPGYSASNFFWSVPDVAPAGDLPAPHNFIIDDLGYFRCDGVGGVPGTVAFEMARPMHVVGGAPGDRVGDVTGLHDINNDGVEDFAVAAPNALRITGEAVPRGAVYVIYRRQSEVEGDYLLEDLARDPATDPNRLNGLMIIGEEGENIGRSMAGGGPLNDDYNNDGYADVLIGSPDAQTAGGPRSGEVFILFGGRNLLNPQGGITLAQLRDRGDGMLLIGERQGDQVGMTLANAGDVNGDRIPDILVAAPGASPYFDSNGDGVPDTIGLDLNGDRIADDLNLDGVGDNLAGAGVVYVVYGGSHLTGTIPLSKIGTAYLPGFIITGRKAGDGLGGGLTQNGLLSRGVSPAGDLDGDGLADLLVSSILADPEGKTDAGEVYLIYGFRP